MPHMREERRWTTDVMLFETCYVLIPPQCMQAIYDTIHYGFRDGWSEAVEHGAVLPPEKKAGIIMMAGPVFRSRCFSQAARSSGNALYTVMLSAARPHRTSRPECLHHTVYGSCQSSATSAITGSRQCGPRNQAREATTHSQRPTKSSPLLPQLLCSPNPSGTAGVQSTPTDPK